jgi:hypothetical protein
MKRYVGTGKSDYFPVSFRVKVLDENGRFYGVDGNVFGGGIKFLNWMVRNGYLAEVKERILENE